MTTPHADSLPPPSPARQFPDSGFELFDDSDVVEEEKYAWYSPKTWYNVKIGEVLHDKYQVITKIGFGTASTSWLCRDLEDHQYVTIKVCCADSGQAQRELESLKHIESVLKTTKAGAHMGASLIRRLLDSFTVSANEEESGSQPNVCFVYKPLGMTLSEMSNLVYEDGIPLNIAKVYTMHILAALDFLHSQTKMVHTDIQAANVMFAIDEEANDFKEVEEEELTEPSARKRRKDGHTIFSSRPIIAEVDHPILCDFGEARFGQDEYNGHVMPDLYRAPEVLLGLPWTSKIDIWALGLMLWGLVEGRQLFRDSSGGRWKSALPHMARMVNLLGPAPQDLLDRSTATEDFFDDKGNLKGGHTTGGPSLADEETKLEGEDKAEFLRFIGRMLRWNPKDRPSARELAEDPWTRSLSDESDESEMDMDYEKA